MLSENVMYNCSPGRNEEEIRKTVQCNPECP